MEVVEKDRDGNCRWVKVDKGDTLYRMIEDGVDDLSNKYGAMDNKVYAKWMEENWPEDEGDDQAKSQKAAVKRWKRDVEHIILNKRKCVQQAGV
jgi:hypothetical protein